MACKLALRGDPLLRFPYHPLVHPSDEAILAERRREPLRDRVAAGVVLGRTREQGTLGIHLVDLSAFTF